MPTPSAVQASLTALAARLPHYKKAREYYEGTRPEVITNKELRDILGSYSVEHRINYCDTPVDVLVERCLIQNPTTEDASAAAFLDQVWRENDMGYYAKDAHKWTFEYGDAYLIAWPEDDDPSLPSGIQLSVHDPSHVKVYYDPRNGRTKTHALHWWCEPRAETQGGPLKEYMRVEVYYPDRIEQYISSRAMAGVDDTELVPYTDDDVDSVAENPFGFVPVYHLRNSRPYGFPESKPAWGAQNMLNKFYVDMVAAVEYMAFPQRWITSDAAMDTPGEVDPFMTAPDDTLTTDYTAPDVKGRLGAGPASVWLLGGSNVAVGEFGAAQISNYLDAIDNTVAKLSAATDIPSYMYDRTATPPSGVAYMRSEAPINKKAKDRQAQLTPVWASVFAGILEMAGQPVPDDLGVSWEPVEVYSDKESWDTAASEQAMGVPLEYIYTERGIAPDVAAEWAADAEAQTQSNVETPPPDAAE